MKIGGRWVTFTIIILAVGASLGAAKWAVSWVDRGGAMNTMSRMRDLWSLCDDGQFKTLEEVLAECQRIGATCIGGDGWGRPFEIEAAASPGGQEHCRIRSLGRDGKRGSCCRRSVGWRWDEDAVLGKTWYQAWNTMDSGRGE